MATTNIRDRLKEKLKIAKVSKVIPAVEFGSEEAKERQRRLDAIDGGSDLQKLRAVSGTTDKVVLNHAIQNLSEIEVGCWAQIFRTAPADILEKAVDRIQVIASSEFIYSVFSSMENPEISDKILEKIFDIAKKNYIIEELFFALPEKPISLSTHKKLSRLFFDNGVAPDYHKITPQKIPLFASLMFLMVSNRTYDIEYLHTVWEYLRRMFKSWSKIANRKDSYEIGCMITFTLPTLVEELKVRSTFDELLLELDFIANQEIR